MLYHLASRDRWEAAAADGYTPVEFAREGFVHLSAAHQVRRTAQRFYAGRDDLVLLVLDGARLEHLMWEAGSHGEGSRFPHHYGPLTRDAVVDVVPLTPAGPSFVELERSAGPAGTAGLAELNGALGTVAELWRYPVKSLQGEPLREASVGPEGVEGDRRFGLVTPSGHVLSAKSERAVLAASARWLGDGHVEITLPDGARVRSGQPATDDVLSAWLGRSVRLHRAGSDERHTVQLIDDDYPDGVEFSTQPGVFYDSSSTLHLLSDGALRAARREHPTGQWDPRRFRANVVVALDGDEAVEDDWVEHDVRLGEVAAFVRKRTGRCVITACAQPGGLEADLEIVRSLRRSRGGDLGVYLRAHATGVVRVGDTVGPWPAGS